MNSLGDSGSGKQRKRILIIDDDEDITMLLHAVLERYGFEIDSYTDPVLAHKNFRSGQYDLAILDIRMPVFNGFLLYQKIRKTDSRIKLCFLTATEYFYEQIREEQGFGHFKQELFLRKPIQIEEFVYTIMKLLESG
jgi:DNA-binding response OmpR family regulator